MNKKRYLYIAMFIPLLMIFILAINIIFFKPPFPLPQYNFVYAIAKGSQAYLCENQIKAKLFPRYWKQNGITNNATDYCNQATFYIYDTAHDENIPVSIKQLFSLTFLSSSQTQDEFYVSPYCRHNTASGWWQYTGNDNTVCLTKHEHRKRLNILISKNDTPSVFIFLGWLSKKNVLNNKEIHHGRK